MIYRSYFKHYLSMKQEQLLARMVRDYRQEPITLTVYELADRYACSYHNMLRIFKFLELYKLIERIRLGWRRITMFKPEIYEYLKDPILFMAKNSYDLRVQLAMTQPNKVAI